MVHLLSPNYSTGYPLYTNFSTFAQDEWRVSPRLSLSLGLRWEVNPAPSVTQGLRPYALLGSDPNTWALAPQGRASLGDHMAQHRASTWRSIHGAYCARPRDGRTWWRRRILRHWPTIGVVGLQRSRVYCRWRFPAWLVSGDSRDSRYYESASRSATECVRRLTPHLQLPYTIQWNVSVEQALGNSQTLTLSYVGSHAERLLQQSHFPRPTTQSLAGFCC